MTIDEFWKLNEGLPFDGAEGVIKERLEKLEPSQLAEYVAHFNTLFSSAYQWQLWAAAYIMEGGCSDDGFIDFRYGLISRGREVFEAAIANPDSLAGVLPNEKDELIISNELFGYVADQVYEAKTGQGMTDGLSMPTGEPTGEEWDFDDEALCATKLPRLTARFLS